MNEYKSKSLYMDQVTGQQIVDKQEEINSKESSYVVATQIFPIKDSIKFSAFIYYKDKFGNIKI